MFILRSLLFYEISDVNTLPYKCAGNGVTKQCVSAPDAKKAVPTAISVV